MIFVLLLRGVVTPLSSCLLLLYIGQRMLFLLIGLDGLGMLLLLWPKIDLGIDGDDG